MGSRAPSLLLRTGWVKTEMQALRRDGSRAGLLKPEESAAAVRQLCDRVTPQMAGAFYDWRGRTLEW